MAGVALCKFGLTPDKFYNLIPVEFTQALQQWNTDREAQERFELEKMRLQTLYLMNVHLKTPLKKVTDLMEFEWDKKESEVFIPTTEDWQHFDKLGKKWQLKQSTN